MHYARQDLLWLKYHLNVEPKKIFALNLHLKLQEQQVSITVTKI